MVNISHQVLEKIEQDKIKPKPRLAFLLGNYAYWILVVLLLVLGAVSSSIVIFSMANTEWDLWAMAAGSGFKFFLTVLPYLWLVFFAGFVALAHFNLRHTKLGYRFSLFKATIVYLFITNRLIIDRILKITSAVCIK